jgi:hypothetical protein
MPANSTTAIAVNVDVSSYTPFAGGGVTASGRYAFSLQDGTVRFSKIPAIGANQVGLLLVLPDNPSDGDTYEFADVDGSLSLGPTLATTHDIIVQIADAGATGRTFEGLGVGFNAGPPPALGFVVPFTGARFQYDEGRNAWMVFESANSLFNLQGEVVTTGNAPIAPTNFAGGAAANLLAFLMHPNVDLGLYDVKLMLQGTLSAADTDYELVVTIVPDVTAFSGGTLIGGALPAPQIRYNGGGAVVVTGGAPVACQGTKLQVATGDIGSVMMTISELLTLSKPTAPATLGTAIVIAIKTTAATVTAMSASASCRAVE